MKSIRLVLLSSLLLLTLSLFAQQDSSLRIAILSLKRGGAGDIATGVRCANFFHIQQPDAEIIFVTDDPVLAKQFKMPDPIEIVDLAMVDAPLSPVDYLVCLPTIDQRTLMTLPLIPSKSLPIGIVEYGLLPVIKDIYCRNTECLQLFGSGAGEGEVGMWVSQEPITEILPKEFWRTVQQDPFFLTYTYEKGRGLEFAAAIAAQFQEEQGAAFSICWIKGDRTVIDEYQQEFYSLLVQLGVVRLEVYEWGNCQLQQEIVFRKEAGNTLKLIITPALLHATFLSLLAASSSECLVTGDQSWSEAIAFDKHWIYECLNHKMRSLQNVLKLAPGVVSDKLWKIAVTDCYTFSKERALEMGKILHEPGVYWENINHILKNNHNIDTFLMRLSPRSSH